MSFIQDFNTVSNVSAFNTYDYFLTNTEDSNLAYKYIAEKLEIEAKLAFNEIDFKFAAAIANKGFDAIEEMLCVEYGFPQELIDELIYGGMEWFQDEDFNVDLFFNNNLQPFIKYLRYLLEVLREESVDFKVVSTVIWFKVLRDYKNQFTFKK